MSINEHTGQSQRTKAPTDKFRDGWDRIFGSKNDHDKQVSKGPTGSHEESPQG